MKFYQQNVSKSVWARGLKIGQLIEDDEKITWLTIEWILISFSELRPFENFDILKLSASYLKKYP